MKKTNVAKATNAKFSGVAPTISLDARKETNTTSSIIKISPSIKKCFEMHS